jgi:hypothetical protein
VFLKNRNRIGPGNMVGFFEHASGFTAVRFSEGGFAK